LDNSREPIRSGGRAQRVEVVGIAVFTLCLPSF
jgi:hypothetical protein